MGIPLGTASLTAPSPAFFPPPRGTQLLPPHSQTELLLGQDGQQSLPAGPRDRQRLRPGHSVCCTHSNRQKPGSPFALCTDPKALPSLFHCTPISFHGNSAHTSNGKQRSLLRPAKATCLMAYKNPPTYLQIKYHLLSQSLGNR